MPQQSTSDVNTSVLANRPAVESTPPGARERLLEVRLKPLEAGSDGASVKRRQHASWDAPLSNSQLGLWLLDRFAGQGSGSNIARATVVQGDLDVSALERSVLTLIQRHESLRTAIEHRDGVAVQRVMTADQASREFSLTPLPIDGGSATESSGKLNALLQSLADIPFDLERAPLLRAHLLQLGETEHVFLLVVHHFVFDAWSMSVLARELRVLYAAGGRATTLPSLPIQFADYAVWQHEKLADGALSGHAEYWRAKLSGLAPLELPTDRPRPARLSQSGGKVRFEIEAAQLGQLKALARRENASLFMVLLSAFQVLLMRCSGQHDLAVGVPTAGRDQVELHGLMGPFANTLVLRSDLSGNPGFTELLGRVRQTALDAFDNQDLPFGQLVAEISPERDPSRNPLFQVGFELQSTPEGNIGLDGLQTRRIDFQRTTPVHDLTLSVTESDGVLRGTFEYATDLFDGSSIERMARHWRTLLGGVAANPSLRLSDLPLLTDSERNQQLCDWNDTKVEYPRNARTHELFDAQAARTPERTALRMGTVALSYAELNARANRIARALRSRGAGRGQRVGLCVERGSDMLAAVLGILKSGAAYVPMDPSFPQERLRFMAEDAQLELHVSTSALAGPFGMSRKSQLLLDLDAVAITSESDQDLVPDAALDARPEDAAYVIYTSGSTGKPKGVVVPHRAVVNFLTSMAREPGMGADDVLVAVTTLSFDIAVLELQLPLTLGATVVIASRDEAIDGHALRALLERTQATVMQATPVTWRLLLEAGWQGGKHFKALIGGEALPKDLADQLIARGIELWNMYGPTETTVWSTCARIDSTTDGITIGKPIANSTVYVLDAQKNLCPIGIPGELCIGGDGVTLGYWNRPDLSADRFISDPFDSTLGSRLYRTGDRARWRNDGTIEHLGRLDFQVKIRGYRIELGEIETGLARHPAIREAVVVVREDIPGDPRLVAYVVAHTPAPADLVEQLRAQLRAGLPEYMMPSAFAVLDAMPLTPNAKVDRKALPAPERMESQASYVAPRTVTEEILAGIWGEVLKLERVSVDANFFELGGHSLLAMQVVSRVRQALSVELPLREIFAAPTIAGLGARLQVLRAEVHAELAPLLLRRSVESGPAELSFAQESMWFLDQVEVTRTAYVIPSALRLEGPLKVPALEGALIAIVARHESLRTTFVDIDDKPKQDVRAHASFTLPIVDAGVEPRRLIALMNEEMQRGFDLAEGSLFRAVLYRLGPEEHVLLLLQHHIISDGWSSEVMLRELAVLYRDRVSGHESALPELPVRYRDFSRWQRERLQGAVLAKEIDYWCSELAGAPQVLELPTDRPRPPTESHRGAHYSFTVPRELSRRLAAKSRHEGTTLLMTTMAAFSVLLLRYTGQDDLLVGMPVANRDRAELEGLVGLFVNTLVLRNDLSGNPTARELLDRVRERCLNAYAHPELPLATLVEALRPARDPSRNPLFQVMLNVQSIARAPFSATGLAVTDVELDRGAAQVDLTLDILETEQGLAAGFEYATDLFDRSTIERMARHWCAVLEGMVTHPGLRLSELPLLGEAERQQILVGWNATACEYGREARLHRLIEEQAAKTPHSVALEFEGQTLSCAEVNRKANQLARVLRKRGVGPDVLVGVLAERSFEMVVALLAVLKAGGAYVPLDPSYPAERLGHMLEDARAPVILAQSHLASQLPSPTGEVLLLESSWSTYAGEAGEDLQDVGTPQDLAYVIFTSGSTGRPKGAMNDHRGICNQLLWMQEHYRLSSDDRFLQKTPFSFDVSVWELFLPLLTGARLVIARPEGHRDSAYLAKLIRERAITTLDIVPSMLRLFLEEEGLEACTSLKRVFCGGEAMPREVQQRFFARLPGVELHNLYGPTETALQVTYWHCRPGDERLTVPIGLPVANTQMYVLDARLDPVPVGVAGEIYIGGVQVGRGYVGRDDLTAERFVPDPFSPVQGARLYKTGDVGRHLPDGVIDYLGRTDFQVKIRGQRIELGEIEAMLDKHAGVRQSVVIAREDTPGNQRLVAYVVAHQPAPSANELKEQLSQELPAYMVPNAFVFLNSLPLTSSGKVDRKALPVPERIDSEVAYDAPSGESEQAVAQIWRELLGVNQVARTDNFFDLGGHSLLAMRAVHLLRKKTGIELDLSRLIFENLAQIAQTSHGAAADASPVVNSMQISIKQFGPKSRQMVGVFQKAKDGARARGRYLLCRPMGQEGVRTAALFRVLSERLALAGCDVLRFDYYGAGDSPGDEGRQSMAAWVDDLMAAHELLEPGQGVPVHWFGMGLGATLALHSALRVKTPPTQLVLWEPVLNGKAYAQMLLDEHRTGLVSGLGEPWAKLLKAGRVIEPTFPGDVLGFDVGRQLADEIQNLNGISLGPVLRRGVCVFSAVHAEQRAFLVDAQASAQLKLHTPETRHNWIASQALGTAIVPEDLLSAVLSTVE